MSHDTTLHQRLIGMNYCVQDCDYVVIDPEPVCTGGGGKKRTKRQREKEEKNRLKLQKDANANFLVNKAVQLKQEEDVSYSKFILNNGEEIRKYIGAPSTIGKKCKNLAEGKANTFGRTGRGGLTKSEMDDIAKWLLIYRVNGVVLSRDRITKEFLAWKAQKLRGNLSKSAQSRLATRTGGPKSMSDLQHHLEGLDFVTYRCSKGVELLRAHKRQPEITAEMYRLYVHTCALRMIHLWDSPGGPSLRGQGVYSSS